jgi:hypothetical protein
MISSEGAIGEVVGIDQGFGIGWSFQEIGDRRLIQIGYLPMECMKK